MKIAFITQDFPPDIGGIQTYSLEIAKRLSKDCEEFVLIAPDKPNASLIDDKLDFEVCRVSTSNTLIGFFSIPVVLKLLKERKIDILIHAQWQSLSVAVLAKKMGLVRFVGVAAHAREYFFNPFEKFAPVASFYERHKKYLIKKADFFFPVSNYTSNILKDYGIPEDKRAVVINGTNPDLFYPMDTEKLKEKHGYSGKEIIITITRLIERKAVDTVLRSIPFIVDEFPNLLYLVVGAGPFKEELLKIVDDLEIQNYVKFLGKVPYEEVNEYYNLSDIYVMPSKKILPEIEAFGIVYLEANACSKPAIGSRTGGIADAILDEETGLLVEERNPKELAAAIKRLFMDRDLMDRLGKQGRVRVEKEANWDAVSKRIYNLIKAQIE